MDMKEFRNKAYEIATKTYLTEKLNEEQFDNITDEQIELFCYSDFKNMPTSEINECIEQLADDIIRAFGHLAEKEK